MKLEHEDPRVIDFALDELDEAERAEIAAALLDPENEDAAAFAQEMAALTALSRAALKEEADNDVESVPIADWNVAKLDPRRTNHKELLLRDLRWLAIAASILLMVAVSLNILPSLGPAREAARRLTPEEMAERLEWERMIIAEDIAGAAKSSEQDPVEGGTATASRPMTPAASTPIPGSSPLVVSEQLLPARAEQQGSEISTSAANQQPSSAPKSSGPSSNVDAEKPRVMVNTNLSDNLLEGMSVKTLTRQAVEGESEWKGKKDGKAKEAPKPADSPSRLTSGGTLLAPDSMARGSKPGPTPRLDGTRAESSEYDKDGGSVVMDGAINDNYSVEVDPSVLGANLSSADPNNPVPGTNPPLPAMSAVGLKSGVNHGAPAGGSSPSMDADGLYALGYLDSSASAGPAPTSGESFSWKDAKQDVAGARSTAFVIENPDMPAAPQNVPVPPVSAGEAGLYSEQHNRFQYGEQARAENDAGPAFQPTAPLSFKSVAMEPLSTFAADVDTASYSYIRRVIENHTVPSQYIIRTEEFINYFDYAYPEPTGEHPFSVTVDVAGCPWAPEHRLARVGIEGKAMDGQERPSANLVFLVDVSGSMESPDKLPLVRESLKGLVSTLKESDRVGIVTYAGESRVALEPTSCEKKADIAKAIDSLTSGGSTNGAGGLTTAYELAQRAYFTGGINRVIIATDGDFNVGVTSHDGLLQLITDKAKSGVFLSVLGYGMGNLMDSTLEMLADKGNGFYAYIDDIAEARRVLVDKGLSAIATIAKDVKFQIEFNPAKVGYYRQIGYENRQLAAQDFNDDTKDAGDIGPGHTVTALYEIVPAGKSPTPGVDPLKYQQTTPAPPANDSPEAMTVKLRYKQPDSQTSKLLEVPVVDNGATFDDAPQDFRFAAAVAAFAEQLKRLQVAQPLSLDQIQSIAAATKGSDPARQEFVDLVVTTKTLAR